MEEQKEEKKTIKNQLRNSNTFIHYNTVECSNSGYDSIF